MKKIAPLWSLISLLFLMLLPSTLHAGGPVHGSKAAGMGTAFVAVADDPAAILHNPAGLAQIKGTNLYGGITAVIPSTDFEDAAGRSEETGFQSFFPPHLYLCSDFGQENLVFGLGLHSTFGVGGRKWRDTGSLRFLSTESSIATFTVNPAIAWQALPSLSLAFGVDYMRSMSDMERMVDQSPLGASDGTFRLETDGGGWGFNAGVLFHLSEVIHLGFAYRSGIEVDASGEVEIDNIAPALQPLFGSSRFTTGAETKADFPEIFSFGIAATPDGRWTLALDVELVRWSSFDEMPVSFEQEIAPAGLIDGTMEFDWDDSLQVKVGADYRVSEKLSLRCGYAHIQASVPEHTLEPGNPDSDQHNLSVGFGYRFGKVVLDIFYNAGFYEERTVDNDILDGTYDNFNHYLGFSVGYRFGGGES